MSRSIRIKRTFDPPAATDGARFLVDRLWPRGVKKDAMALDGWLRDVAPSDALRRWFAHRPDCWPDFVRRYAAELDREPTAWRPILDAARCSPVALVFAARDVEHNNATALRDYLTAKLKRRGTRENGGDKPCRSSKEGAP
jgi:uncharacterized protein YeaO (DUF488 family)